MKRVLEFFDSEGPLIYFIGVALVIWSLFGGIALIAHQAGPSWSEICVAQGGAYTDDEHFDFGSHHDEDKYTETCTPKAK